MTDYSTYTHMTETEFRNHCDSVSYEGDYYRENDAYLCFYNAFGCMLAKLDKITGVYWNF